MHNDKKDNKIFLIHKEIQIGAVAKSYMRKGSLIFEERWIDVHCTIILKVYQSVHSYAESRPSVKCCWLWTRRRGGHHHLLLPSHPPHPPDSGTSSVPHRPVINTGGSGAANLLPARPSPGQGWRSPCGPRGSWAASTPATHHVHGVAALYSLCISLLCSQLYGVCVYGYFKHVCISVCFDAV